MIYLDTILLFLLIILSSICGTILILYIGKKTNLKTKFYGVYEKMKKVTKGSKKIEKVMKEYKIPSKRLVATKKKGIEGKRARLAETLNKVNKKKK